MSWEPTIAVPGSVRVYGDAVSVEVTPVRYITIADAAGSDDLVVGAGSRIRVPMDVRFGHELTPPEAITAHIDVDVEALQTGSSLTRTDSGFIDCCEGADGLYVLGATPDASQIVAIANYRGADDSERLRIVANASLRWVPGAEPVQGDPVISIPGIDVVD